MTLLTPLVAIARAAGPPTSKGANLLGIINTIGNRNNGDKMILDGKPAIGSDNDESALSREVMK